MTSLHEYMSDNKKDHSPNPFYFFKGIKNTMPHRFNTWAQAKTMIDENVAQLEKIERDQHELRELLVRNQEEHQEQLAKMMEMMVAISKGNGVAKVLSSQEGPAL